MANSGVTAKHPLSSLRITIKDIFALAPFCKSLGSRGYLATYPPASHTAPAIQALLDRGAQLVGLSHMCALVLSQEPTQSVDFPAPFNPRADGYQSPSGGSSGQASAVAAYEWLDVAIGSDCMCVCLYCVAGGHGDVIVLTRCSDEEWADARASEWVFLAAAHERHGSD